MRALCATMGGRSNEHKDRQPAPSHGGEWEQALVAMDTM